MLNAGCSFQWVTRGRLEGKHGCQFKTALCKPVLKSMCSPTVTSQQNQSFCFKEARTVTIKWFWSADFSGNDATVLTESVALSADQSMSATTNGWGVRNDKHLRYVKSQTAWSFQEKRHLDFLGAILQRAGKLSEFKKSYSLPQSSEK